VVHVYPMPLPDQVYDGDISWGVPNANRMWYPGAPPDGEPSEFPEINFLRQDILASTGGHVAYGFDLHSGVYTGNASFWGLMTSGPANMRAAALRLVQRIYVHDRDDHGGVPRVKNYLSCDISASPDTLAQYWLYDTMGAIPFTFEPGNIPPEPLWRIEDMGVSIGKGLADLVCATDCNQNAIPDDIDLTTGASGDCQLNGIPDECDIASGNSADANEDGIPDDCQILLGDLNCDHVLDNADIPAFVLALTARDAYEMAYLNCQADVVGDINADGTINNADIPYFVRLLLGPY